MNAEAFLANFGNIANAPGGVMRLREIVLQLAVTGHLTVKDESEGTADDFNRKIQDARHAFAKSEGVKLATVAATAAPSELEAAPSHWLWCKLGDLTTKIGSGSTPRGGSKVYVSKGIPFLRSQNVWNEGLRMDDVVYIPDETHASMKGTHVQANDILLNITGASLGRCALVSDALGPANVSQHVTIIRCALPDVRQFIRLCLLSPFGQAMIWGRQVGMAREGLSKKVLEQFEIPLPPLAEQNRIVAKVDDLMALCDQLEAQQQERNRCFPVLSRSCHASFAEAPTPTNLNRIFEETGAVSPADIRKTILNLGFAGRLCSQLADDEPASILLERAKAEKAKLIAEGIVKKEPWGSDVHGTKSLYELPRGWTWAHVSDVVEKVTVGFVGSMKQHYRGSGIPFLRSQNVRENRFEPAGLIFISEEFHKVIAKSTLRPGDVVVTRSGNVGVTCVIPESVPESNCSDLVIVKRPLAIDPAFLSYFMNSIAGGQILEKTVGIALTHFNTQSVAQLTVALPPLAEQRRIVAKVDELMALADQLEAQQQERDKLAEAFAKACVASFTGTTQLERPEKMKAPKTELVSLVTLGKKPKPDAKAPLAKLLSQNKGTLPAKSLWQQSGLTIDDFYQQLKSEITQGWIAKPVEAEMKILKEA